MSLLDTDSATFHAPQARAAMRTSTTYLLAFIAMGCGAKIADDQSHAATGGAGIQGGTAASGGGATGGAMTPGGAAATGGASSQGGSTTTSDAPAAGGTRPRGSALATGGVASGGYANPLGGIPSLGGSASTGGTGSCRPKSCSDFGNCPCAVQLDGCGAEIDCGPCNACCPLDCEMLCANPDVHLYCIAVIDADSGTSAPCVLGDGCGRVLFCDCAGTSGNAR